MAMIIHTCEYCRAPNNVELHRGEGRGTCTNCKQEFYVDHRDTHFMEVEPLPRPQFVTWPELIALLETWIDIAPCSRWEFLQLLKKEKVKS